MNPQPNLIARLLPTNYASWPDDVTLTLISRRRAYQPHFATSRVRDQDTYWNLICNDVIAQHPGFVPTVEQCRRKWNSLKSGYENLSRLMEGNINRYPTRTPSMHDETFFNELSDEFWLQVRKYLFR